MEITSSSNYDLGLRQYLVSVFNYMALALTVSGAIAAYIGFSPDLANAIWKTSFKWVAIFSPLVIAFIMAFTIDKMSVSASKFWLMILAASFGVSISSIFLIYKMGSIAQIFFVSAATFGVTALYGYTTKRDLSNMGSFLFMGLIGIIIAGLLNIFIQSSLFSFVISVIAVLIFVGFTAYDMQSIKNTYYNSYGDEREKLGVMGALNLYLDFINIFLNLLNLAGERK